MHIPNGDVIAVDTECTGLNPWHGDQPFAISFCNEKGETGYVQWPVNADNRKVRVPYKDYFQLKKWLADERIVKVFFNASFDIRMLEVGLRMEVRGKIEDAQIAMHVCNTVEPDYKLKNLCKRYGIMSDSDEKQLKKVVMAARKQANKKGWNTSNFTAADYWIPKQLDPNSSDCEKYAVNDAIRTMALWFLLDTLLDDLKRRESYNFEMQELYWVIYSMEARGLAIYPDVLDEEIEKCKNRAEMARQTLCEKSGKSDFNPGSYPQVSKLLFDTCKLTSAIRTKGGSPSTKTEALQDHNNHPAVKALVEYRTAAKGISGFFEPYHKFKVRSNDGTWVIHPNIRQAGKKTGRLSCSRPNLQGVADSEGGRSDSNVPARKPFGPRPNFAWFLFDYNQLEVRTFAAASKYDKLIDILLSGRDLHTETTNGIWGGRGNPRAIEAAMHALNTRDWRKAREWLKKFQYDIVKAEASLGKKTSRSKGKPFFFTRMFGGGKKSISEKLRCSIAEAAKLINSYDLTLPGVIGFVRRMETIGKKQRYVETLYGRKLDLPYDEWHKASPYIVQGTAADLIKRAMINCDSFIRKKGIPGGLLLQIHDELIFELPTNVNDEIILELKCIMEAEGDTIGMEVPCKVKLVTKHWSETTDWKKQKP